MGCICAKDEHPNKKKAKTAVHKFVLVGPHGGGKTTLVKQFQLSHGQFDSTEHRHTLAPFILRTIAAHLHALAQSTIDFAAVQELPPATLDRMHALRIHAKNGIDAKLSSFLKELCNDHNCIDTLDRLHLPFFDLDHILCLSEVVDRISSLPDIREYVPVHSDLLRIHWYTVGTTETFFKLQPPIQLIDTGGYLTERPRFLHLLDDVSTHLLFVVAADCFTGTMEEDSATNRMSDALSMFQQIALHVQPPRRLVLVINKMDLFHQKFHRFPSLFAKVFPDFEGKQSDSEEQPPSEASVVPSDRSQRALSHLEAAFAQAAGATQYDVVRLCAIDQSRPSDLMKLLSTIPIPLASPRRPVS